MLVVGMHRSGTSAVTGALGALGCNLPGADDRMVWTASNPEHYESLSLSVFDEDLLTGLGGSWDAPPVLPPHWLHSAAILAAGRARPALRHAFPNPGAAVWKDPRLCLLLPYWRRELPGPVAAVFVWRSADAVACSLERRDGIPVDDGLALWERYNRCALAGLRGMAVSVVEYDTVVADPMAFVEDTAAWLETLAGFSGARASADPEAATKIVRSDLRHHGSAPAAHDVFDDRELRSLTDLLRGLDGHHRSLAAPRCGPESAWTTALLEHRRRQARYRALLDAFARQREAGRHRYFVDRDRRAAVDHAWAVEVADREADLAQLRAQLAGAQDALADLHNSTSWRITRPLRWSTAQLEQVTRPRAPSHSDSTASPSRPDPPDGDQRTGDR